MRALIRCLVVISLFGAGLAACDPEIVILGWTSDPSSH